MKPPTKADLLDEIRRLRAENERLTRLVATQRPELVLLRDVACGVRDFLITADRLREAAIALLPPGGDDLPAFAELYGICGIGRDRVDAALASKDEA